VARGSVGNTSITCERGHVHEPSKWLPPVPSRPSELLSQLRLGPRRLAQGIPFGQHAQSVLIIKGEAAHEAAADAKCVQVAVLAGVAGGTRAK
jgi:hypothetical protein